MCGIVAVYNASRGALEEARRMLERLSHRGPDDKGNVLVAGNWLGHRRLAIVDVSGGRQPLRAETDFGALYLIGNGEVYNHDALRKTLPGVRFTTRSDNEVALRVVVARGEEAVGELRGMFAFALAGEDGSFLAARDPVGIKPLYWTPEGEQVLFASEIAAFDPERRPEVETFPPGHYWSPESGLVRYASAAGRGREHPRTFDVSFDVSAGGEVPKEVLRAVREKLVETVEGQMMGDVPVGVFLSGGLDSSLVAAIAGRYYERRGERLKTFAVGLEGSPDLEAARRAAEYLGAEHHESLYTAEDALRTLPEVVRAVESFDPSLVRSAVPNYILACFAAGHVKVVLTGEGADEIFAGYEYLRGFATEEELHAELVRTVEGLHNLNLQRCDRVTMAHGLEARVPFLELEMIELGLALPAALKLAPEGEPEKRLLRLAFSGWLPEDLLWREKSQFGDGSGAASVLKKRMENSVSREEFEELKGETDPPLRTREEAAYYRIFREHLGEEVPTGRTVGRFATA